MGCTKEGILKAAQVEIYTNSGCTLDLSPAVLHRAMWHVDNAYFIPHWRVVGRNCRTNVPSNTAFRGFGGPQGMLVAETFISKVAEVKAEEGKWERGKRWRVGRRPCGLQFDKVHSLCLNFSNFFPVPTLCLLFLVICPSLVRCVGWIPLLSVSGTSTRKETPPTTDSRWRTATSASAGRSWPRRLTSPSGGPKWRVLTS